MTKIKKVKRIKYPTLKQMSNMASNLRHKFNKSISVEVIAWHMTHLDNPNSKYSIYIEGITDTYYLNSWSDLQSQYFKLMEDIK